MRAALQRPADGIRRALDMGADHLGRAGDIAIHGAFKQRAMFLIAQVCGLAARQLSIAFMVLIHHALHPQKSDRTVRTDERLVEVGVQPFPFGQIARFGAALQPIPGRDQPLLPGPIPARAEIFLAAVLTFIFFTLLLANVAGRFFGAPLIWVDEVAVNLMVIATFLAAAAAIVGASISR